jgi:hypothetical protein
MEATGDYWKPFYYLLELTDRHTAAVDQITTRIDGAPCAVLVVPDIDPRRKPS